jgi:hypothetical protein
MNDSPAQIADVPVAPLRWQRFNEVLPGDQAEALVRLGFDSPGARFLLLQQEKGPAELPPAAHRGRGSSTGAAATREPVQRRQTPVSRPTQQ